MGWAGQALGGRGRGGARVCATAGGRGVAAVAARSRRGVRGDERKTQAASVRALSGAGARAGRAWEWPDWGGETGDAVDKGKSDDVGDYFELISNAPSGAGRGRLGWAKRLRSPPPFPLFNPWRGEEQPPHDPAASPRRVPPPVRTSPDERPRR